MPASHPAPRVATVAVHHEVPHLDRLFDYSVPPELDAGARPGVRCRVGFAGRLLSGFIVARPEATGYTGDLKALKSLSGTEPVLADEVAALCRAVADRWAGTLSDVLRLAVPARHARVEKEPGAPPASLPEAAEPGQWSAYGPGPALLRHLGSGERPGPRAVWAALPGSDWAAAIAVAARATLAAGRGVVIVVPDGRDSARVAAALAGEVGPERFVELTADLGPAERYRRFLRVSRGQVQVVVGTRAAGYAPVRDLGLVVVWDDGSDLHEEPHAPYANIRDVLVLRAHLAGAGALIGGHAPSAEAVSLVESGWARPLAAARPAVREAAARVEVAGSEHHLARDPMAAAARLPDLAFAAVRRALDAGRPALVSVPRRGYRPALACARCRTPARCPVCSGPLAQAGADTAVVCRWCATAFPDLACPECGAHERRAVVVGHARTAEELGRAFPGVPVIRSAGADVVPVVDAAPALVVATPGAEPVAAAGYGTVLLLDAWALLGRADLRAGEVALQRWMAAAALAVPAGRRTGGPRRRRRATLAPVQALVRWDPLGYAAEEAAGRAELGFPPVSRMAALDGAPRHLDAFVEEAELPRRLPGAELLGPVPRDDDVERLLIRVPRAHGTQLASVLQELTRVRSARKEPVVRVRLDPRDIG